MVSTVDSVIVFGGFSEGENSKIINAFKDNTWSKIGELSQARLGHASISFNGDIFVFGGGVTPK